jgi:hypothetical protein
MNFNFNTGQFELSGPYGPTGIRGIVGGGIPGPQGPQGKQGTVGNTGLRGIQGIDGTRGSLIDYGASDPVFSFTNNAGDIYYNFHTRHLFRFEENNWVHFLNLLGPTGEKGNTGPANSCDNPTPLNTFLLYQRIVNDLSTTSSNTLTIVTPGHFGVNGVVAQLTPPFDTITVTWKIDLLITLSPSTVSLVTNIYTNGMLYDGEEKSRVTRIFTESIVNYTVTTTFEVGTIPVLNPLVFVIPKWSVTNGILTMNPGGYFITNVN